MNFAVIFDMDGVLVHNDKYHLEAWRLFCESKGKNVSYDQIQRLFGNTNQQFLRVLIDPAITEADIARFAVEKETIYRDLFEKHIEPAEGLLPFLKELLRYQVPMAVATSAPTANLNFVLDRCTLRSYFKVLVDETFVTHGKPDPEIYLKTAGFLGLEPSRCIVIEDSLFGLEAAQRAGMQTIGLASTLPVEKLQHASMVIRTFHEVTYEKVANLMDLKAV